MNTLGLYIHVPFCDGKCPYCDFYSSYGAGAAMDEYAAATERSLRRWGEKLKNKTVDTVYFGGGTPSLLGYRRIADILKAAGEAFVIGKNAEITLEANPRSSSGDFFKEIAKAGVNRLSVGVQSFNESELAFLRRRHTAADACDTVVAAADAGIKNISLDLMINLPEQTENSITDSVARAAALPITHISVYMLKHERGTAFEKIPPIDGDAAADQYLLACEAIEKAGFAQYEISNFARPGFESRHNLKYWHCEEYLGIGPSAHSFMGGKRFFYPRDTAAFIAGNDPVADGDGGDARERAMLNLRLCEGVPYPCEALNGNEKKYISAGLMKCEDGRLKFTKNGFLISNGILADIL